MSIFKDILKFGTGLLGSTGVVGATVAVAINKFLSLDDQVDSNTPISEVEGKFNKLTPDQQAMVSNAYYDYMKVKEETDFKEHRVTATTEVDRLRIMEETDRSIGIRPKLAMMFGWCVVIMLTILTGALCVVAVKTQVFPSWEILGALFGIPSWVIRSYFKDRSLDKQTKASILLNGVGAVQQNKGLLSKLLGG